MSFAAGYACSVCGQWVAPGSYHGCGGTPTYPHLYDTTSDTASLLAQIKYAWECAENMRGWAVRSDETNRVLREELFGLRSLRPVLDAARVLLTRTAGSEVEVDPNVQAALDLLRDVVSNYERQVTL